MSSQHLIVEQRLDAIAENLDQIERATLGPEESSQKYEREPLVDLLENVRATAELARLVEESLGRDDFANRVVGATATEGGGRR